MKKNLKHKLSLPEKGSFGQDYGHEARHHLSQIRAERPSRIGTVLAKRFGKIEGKEKALKSKMK